MYAQDNILCQFGLINLSSVQQLISQPILIHFWWELYQHITSGTVLNVSLTMTNDISNKIIPNIDVMCLLATGTMVIVSQAHGTASLIPTNFASVKLWVFSFCFDDMEYKVPFPIDRTALVWMQQLGWMANDALTHQ